MNTEPLDLIPLWCFFPLIFVIGMLTIEGGYRLGRARHTRGSGETDSPEASMVASVLGLLAFMLAFTFSLAAARFDARRQAVFDEANSIGTTYLRTRLLSEPERSAAAALLREYTERRAQVSGKMNIAELKAVSEGLHQKLWDLAVQAAEKDPSPTMSGLFLQSLNETIDLHEKRLFVGVQSRIPLTLWLTLFLLTLLGMASVGYQAGISASRRSPEMAILMLAFTSVLFLVVDLDRAHEGLMKVSQQPMIDLLNTMPPTQSK